MTKFRTAALALAGILALTAASTSSASAQWRRHGGWGWGPGIAAGVATGALIGCGGRGAAVYRPTTTTVSRATLLCAAVVYDTQPVRLCAATVYNAAVYGGGYVRALRRLLRGDRRSLTRTTSY